MAASWLNRKECTIELTHWPRYVEAAILQVLDEAALPAREKRCGLTAEAEGNMIEHIIK
jgi:hypothetical protein